MKRSGGLGSKLTLKLPGSERDLLESGDFPGDESGSPSFFIDPDPPVISPFVPCRPKTFCLFIGDVGAEIDVSPSLERRQPRNVPRSY